MTRLLEEHRSTITAERSRNSFFDIEQAIIDQIIDFKYSRGEVREAYEYSELCRARSLLSLMKTATDSSGSSSPTARPLVLSDIQNQLPSQAELLQYSVLDKRVVAWLVRKSDLRSVEAAVDAAQLRDTVSHYLTSLENPSEANAEETSALARRLYEVLIGPIEASLDKTKQLVIVPDKILNYIPIHALVNPTSERYLLEDFCISYSPSSTTFIINTDSAKQKGLPIEEKLVSVGGPRLSRVMARRFADLPSARTEAQLSARHYKDPWILVGANASEGQVKSLIEKSDVVLLATHYDADQDSSDGSRLLLAEEPNRRNHAASFDGMLTAAEVLALDLKRPRLVVLSACRTGIEKVYAGEGAMSMARSFIAKGVPVAVASLWAVDSEATADLMIRFHDYRRVDGLSTSKALRRAQLDAIYGDDSRRCLPYYWAAFVTIGGYAEF